MWDDHDYGYSNGNKNFYNKDKVKDLFIEFLDEPHDYQRLMQKNSGLY